MGKMVFENQLGDGSLLAIVRHGVRWEEYAALPVVLAMCTSCSLPGRPL